MTCIVGYADGKNVWMGGDSAAVGSDSLQVIQFRKVFRVGNFLIGYTYRFRHGQLIQYQFHPRHQEETETDMQYMVNVVVEDLRKLFRDGGSVTTENGKEDGGCVLIGYRGNLYKIQLDYSVLTYKDNLDAIGIGWEFAIGAMDALTGLPPDQRIMRALEVSGKYSTGVSSPYYVEVL